MWIIQQERCTAASKRQQAHWSAMYLWETWIEKVNLQQDISQIQQKSFFAENCRVWDFFNCVLLVWLCWSCQKKYEGFQNLSFCNVSDVIWLKPDNKYTNMLQRKKNIYMQYIMYFFKKTLWQVLHIFHFSTSSAYIGTWLKAFICKCQSGCLENVLNPKFSKAIRA